MNHTKQDQPGADVTPQLIAEAAAWVAVLHGPNRTSSMERGFAKWLKSSEAHARAFGEATAIWEETRALPRPRRLRTFRRDTPSSFFMRHATLAAILLVALGVGASLTMRDGGIATGVGEQRVLALEDGTRVTLNTQTQVVVRYTRNARRIELKSGEALFNVARRADWPFYVTAGDQTIRALGTSFAVRRDKDQVSVTLVDGKVTVAQTATPATTAKPSAIALTPGERVVFAPKKLARADRPQIDKLLAWQRGEVALSDVTLADAIAEMNRYSREAVVAQVSAARPIRVTGLFRAGDSMSFARAVAEAYQLKVVEQDGEIHLVSARDVPTN
jgi:transmembrane sensor